MNQGPPAWKPSALMIALRSPYINEMKKLWYLNQSGFCLTLHATAYTIPYSERSFFGLSEFGTQKFASLDFREVCLWWNYQTCSVDNVGAIFSRQYSIPINEPNILIWFYSFHLYLDRYLHIIPTFTLLTQLKNFKNMCYVLLLLRFKKVHL